MAYPRNKDVCDVAVVGAGLAGGLLALALAHKHPELDVRLIDGADRVGGNHLWSFFGSDVADADRWLVDPLVVHRWRDYEVRFPAHGRVLGNSYHSIESSRLDRVVRERLPEGALMLGRAVADAGPTAVAFRDGGLLEARGVVDARGPGDLSTLELGWQKFLGREIAVDAAHRVERPVVMDATVEQVDGYRFVYVMPFSAERLFVEDTYYSDDAALDTGAVARRLDGYAAAKGWRGAVVREERGVLPVAIGGDFEGYWRSGGAGVAKAGMRAGLFHPTTGYSLPDAVRLATMLAARRDFAGADLHEATHAYAEAKWGERRFYRMLDAMLFRAAEPEARYRVLERFYRLDPQLIGRFYAGRSTMTDKARILMGKPPVPIGRAIRAIRSAA